MSSAQKSISRLCACVNSTKTVVDANVGKAFMSKDWCKKS